MTKVYVALLQQAGGNINKTNMLSALRQLIILERRDGPGVDVFALKRKNIYNLWHAVFGMHPGSIPCRVAELTITGAAMRLCSLLSAQLQVARHRTGLNPHMMVDDCDQLEYYTVDMNLADWREEYALQLQEIAKKGMSEAAGMAQLTETLGNGLVISNDAAEATQPAELFSL
jgi:hypothetical protein